MMRAMMDTYSHEVIFAISRPCVAFVVVVCGQKYIHISDGSDVGRE